MHVWLVIDRTFSGCMALSGTAPSGLLRVPGTNGKAAVSHCVEFCSYGDYFLVLPESQVQPRQKKDDRFFISQKRYTMLFLRTNGLGLLVYS